MLAPEGGKILDLTRQGPGPFCIMILGDMGAGVVKIEAPPALGVFPNISQKKNKGVEVM